MITRLFLQLIIPRNATRSFASLVGVFLISQGTLNAAMTFDWPSSPGWTAGAPAPGQTKTQDFTPANPDNIIASINNNGAGVQGVVWNAGGYPQINATADTGGFAGINGLQLLVTNSQVVGAYVRTTINFATAVTNLSFQIWDIDAVPGQFIDKISNIQALAAGGGTVGPDSVTSAVAGFNTITGSGLGTLVLGTANANNTTNQGTIDIVFNGPITQFSFDWANNDSALGAQGIAVSPLTYSPVPELDPSWIAAATCAVAVGLQRGRRKSKRSSR